MILKEISHRWVGFLLSLAAATVAVALCVGIGMTQAAAEKETRRNARDIGSNVFIIPASCDLYDYYQAGYSRETMSQDSIEKMVSGGKISYNHLIPTLTAEVPVRDRTVRLTGIAMAQHPPGRPSKSKMGTVVEPGHVHLGSEVARLLKAKKGAKLDLLGRSWFVERVAPEMGTVDDITILADLGDVQQVLGRAGRISQIKAISCVQCDTPEDTSLATLRRELTKILPGTQVYLMKEIADARVRQRRMMETYSPFVITVLLIVCAAWLGLLSAINVRERISEIGLLRAIGYGGGTIGFLILGRAGLVGILAAVVGCGIGSYLAFAFGPAMFPVAAGAIRADWALFFIALVAAPLLAILASFIPAALAICHDPAVTLREDV
jgi:putative ABC transport system permease protein